MEAPERFIQRNIENLSHQESQLLQTELEHIEKLLSIEDNFIAAINSSELLDLVISIFLMSIASLVTISNIFSSLANTSSKTFDILFCFLKYNSLAIIIRLKSSNIKNSKTNK